LGLHFLVYWLDNLEKFLHKKSVEGAITNTSFVGQFASALMCAECGVSSHRAEKFCDISVEIPARFLPQNLKNMLHQLTIRYVYYYSMIFLLLVLVLLLLLLIEFHLY
jgi:hypothetical protein